MAGIADLIISGAEEQTSLEKKQWRIGFVGCALFFVLTLALFGSYQGVRAGDGDLDLVFGNGGKVITDFNTDDYVRAIVVQPDGKIVAVGQTGAYPVFHGALARYNLDGSLDQTFGNGGKITTGIDPEGEVITAALIQPDGKIVVAGTVVHNNFPVGMFVARFNPDGVLYDQSFGPGGGVVYNFGDSTGEANAVVLQSDGKIIVAGFSGFSTYGSLQDFALARFNPDGSFDQTYGTGGKIKTHFAPDFGGARGATAVLQPDGKLIVGGRYKNDPNTAHWDFALARYNTDGSLDQTFGSGGKVTTSLGASDSVGIAVSIQRDGKIVLAGSYNTGRHNGDFAAARYDANGNLDTTFGNGGWVINDLFGSTDDLSSSVVILPDGKIVVAGRTGQYPNFRFGAVRYTPYGALDQTFGSGGKVMTDFGGPSSQAYALARQSDGKIVIGGYALSGTNGTNFNTSFALARYRVAAPRATGFDFDGDLKTDASIFRQGAWYVNRSTMGFMGVNFGLAGDRVVPADYDGDSKADVAVFRPGEGNWYWLSSSNGTYNALHFGSDGDIPLASDYDGDGRADYTVFRGGTWYVQRSTDGLSVMQFGLAGDRPVPADFDGDNKTDIAVYRDGTWYVQKTTGGFIILQLGVSTDVPVVNDYDGDHKADVAVWRPADGVWYYLRSSDGIFSAYYFGANGDTPVPGDYDGDGKADLAIFRGGGWFIWQSQTNSYAFQQFGQTGDKPVPSAYIP